MKKAPKKLPPKIKVIVGNAGDTMSPNTGPAATPMGAGPAGLAFGGIVSAPEATPAPVTPAAPGAPGQPLPGAGVPGLPPGLQVPPEALEPAPAPVRPPRAPMVLGRAASPGKPTLAPPPKLPAKLPAINPNKARRR